jgi:hypothetical protein
VKRLIYVGQDDDISDLAGRLQGVDKGDEVALVVPAGAQGFQAPLHLRLLGQLSARRGHRVVLVTPDSRLQEQARGAGLTAYSSVAAYEDGVPSVPHGPGPGFNGHPRASGLPAAGAPPGAHRRPALPSPDTPLGPAGPPVGGWMAPPAPAGGGRPAPAGAGGNPVGPHADEFVAVHPPGGPRSFAEARPREAWPAGGGASGFPGYDDADVPSLGGGAATAVAPPPARPIAPPGPPGGGAGRPASGPPGRAPARRPPRTPLYFALMGIGILGVVLFLVLTPTATVAVTIAEQPLSVSPIIQGGTAAPKPGQADYIQTRVVQDSASQQFTATPTGTKSIPATAATGQVVLTADNPPGYCIQPGTLAFQTASGTQYQANVPSGVEVLAAGEQPLPGNACNLPSGFAVNTVNVQAVQPGSSGNVPANSITQWAPSFCAGNGSANYCSAITLTNPQATSGGQDAQQQTVASAADIQGWQSQVSQICSQLSAQVDGALQQKAGPDRPAVDPTGGGKSTSCTPSPNVTQVSAGTQMTTEQVTVTMTASETVYSQADVVAAVLADLRNPHPAGGQPGLPAGDSLVPGKLVLSGEQVTQASSDGSLAISVTGTDFYRPATIDLTALRDQMTGHNPGDVPGIVEQRVDNVEDVTVHESPFTLFFMPFFSSNITITENFVAPASSAGG